MKNHFLDQKKNREKNQKTQNFNHRYFTEKLKIIKNSKK